LNVANSTSVQRQADRAVDPMAAAGLRFGVASSCDQVVEAWSLVYRSYLRAGLIRPNPWRLHTVEAAIHPQTLVVMGRITELVVATVSAFVDDGRPLPADQICPDAMARLRSRGRRVMEVSLLADRREHVARSLNSLMELMRYAFFYAIYRQVNDVIIGVNGRHARFYERCFGFERLHAPPQRTEEGHDTSVPLRLDIDASYHRADKLPSGLALFRSYPVEADAYDKRYPFDRDEIASSDLGAWLVHDACEQRETAE
jgi:hypothetical protein